LLLGEVLVLSALLLLGRLGDLLLGGFDELCSSLYVACLILFVVGVLVRRLLANGQACVLEGVPGAVLCRALLFLVGFGHMGGLQQFLHVLGLSWELNCGPFLLDLLSGDDHHLFRCLDSVGFSDFTCRLGGGLHDDLFNSEGSLNNGGGLFGNCLRFGLLSRSFNLRGFLSNLLHALLDDGDSLLDESFDNRCLRYLLCFVNLYGGLLDDLNDWFLLGHRFGRNLHDDWIHFLYNLCERLCRNWYNFLLDLWLHFLLWLRHLLFNRFHLFLLSERFLDLLGDGLDDHLKTVLDSHSLLDHRLRDHLGLWLWFRLADALLALHVALENALVALLPSRVEHALLSSALFGDLQHHARLVRLDEHKSTFGALRAASLSGPLPSALDASFLRDILTLLLPAFVDL